MRPVIIQTTMPSLLLAVSDAKPSRYLLADTRSGSGLLPKIVLHQRPSRYMTNATRHGLQPA